MSYSPALADRRLVTFDRDGVLVDSECIVHTLLANMLLELGIELSLTDTVDAFIWGPDSRDLAVIKELTGSAPAVEFMEGFKQETRKELKLVTLVPGVLDVSRHKALGIKGHP